MDPLPPHNPPPQDEPILDSPPLVSQPIPQAALPEPAPQQPATTLSPADARFLTAVGRVVAACVVLLGIASIALCAYVAYRAVVWFWFTP